MSFSNTNITTSVSVVFCFLFMLLLPFDQLLAPFDLDAFKQEYLGDSLKNIIIVIFGSFIISRFGYTKVSGLTNFRPKHAFLLLFPLFFILLGPIEYFFLDYQFENIRFINVLILFCSMITVGLSEEIIFRGFVLPNLIKGTSSDQSLVVPIFLASLLFGVLHFLNLLQPDTYFPLVLSQVIYATMFGVGFGIILLRTGSIFPLGLLHGIINFSSNWDDLPGTIEPTNLEAYRTHEAIISVIIVIPFLIYTLLQISKIDRNALLNLYE